MKARFGRVLVLICGILAVQPDPSKVDAAQKLSAQQHVCIFDHMMLRSTSSVCRPRARIYPRAVKGSVERAIYDGSLTFGIPFEVLLNIAKCESGLNSRADNGAHFGLFQFAPSTFTRAALQLRKSTGVVARSYWDPLDSAYVAGYMFATGEAPRWACEPPLP